MEMRLEEQTTASIYVALNTASESLLNQTFAEVCSDSQKNCHYLRNSVNMDVVWYLAFTFCVIAVLVG